jgi:hypothetical protein
MSRFHRSSQSLSSTYGSQTTKSTPSASIGAFGGLAKKKPLAHRAAANVSDSTAAASQELLIQFYLQ